jgi:hypothetical protein
MDFVANSEEPLRLIEDDSGAYIGRKKSHHAQYGNEGALLLGRSVEEKDLGQRIYLDALSPHVVFITGARGSGKSYSLGNIAEELALRNPNVASVIIDPIGIFWSMKYPNKDERELKELADWGLEPEGIDKTQVFIPLGMKAKVPKETYDRLFSLRVSELTADDWCLTFGLDRFSPTGLLLEKVLDKAKNKFKNNYSIDDVLKIIDTDKEINDKTRGYKPETKRALASRLEASKNWGILSKEGTSLAELCKEGHVSVIDISFLEENVASLVIGLLSRKILNARKLVARKSTMKKYVMSDIDELLDVEIPPTWLFIDEAHTLIPSGSKTAASDALIEYVKQGRRPGCSLVFATQQPSAIDTKVLSQLDILLCHKLVFDEDLRAVMKRMPTLMPKEYDNTKFIRTLPIGIGLIGDRSEETSRAFCIQVRPRFSQHEGREIKSIELDEKMTPKEHKEEIISLTEKKLTEQGSISQAKVEEIVDTANRRYSLKINADEIISLLADEKGYKFKDGVLTIPGFEEARETAEKMTEAPSGKFRGFVASIDEAKARAIAEKARQKKTLGLFGSEESLTELKLMYEPIYKVSYDLLLEKGFRPLIIYLEATGEIYYYDRGLKKTKDMGRVMNLDERRLRIIQALEKPMESKKLVEKTSLTPQAVTKYLRELAELGFIEQKEKVWRLKQKLDVPKTIDTPAFTTVEEKLPIEQPEAPNLEKGAVDEKLLRKIPLLFGSCRITSVEMMLMPKWRAAYSSPKGPRVEKFLAV